MRTDGKGGGVDEEDVFKEFEDKPAVTGSVTERLRNGMRSQLYGFSVI